MRSNIPYPDERLLIIRPCHVSLCLGVHSAAKTLAALLYRYSQSCGDEAREVDQDAVFRIRCKQSDLIKDMIGEITEKTLHDTAIPWLQFLGYLDIEELPGKNCYALHIGRIFKGLAAYTKDLKNKTHCQLEEFLIDVPELKKVLIGVKGLEEFLINKKNFLLQLEKVRIGNRNSSNCQRGRKPRPQAALEGNDGTPKIHIDSSLDNNKENIPTDQPATPTVVANATIPSVSSSSDNLEQESFHVVNTAIDEDAENAKGAKDVQPQTNGVEPKTTRNGQSIEQDPLFDASSFIPVMPSATTEWCAETLVQIVEFKRGKRFLEEARGKSQKSQRERQLEAAKKIKAAKITREEFVRAYDARNDEWWKENQGELTVVEMAANTKNKVMRTLEVLENLDKKNAAKTSGSSKPSSTQSTQKPSASAYTPEEIKKLRRMDTEERKVFLSQRREERERNAVAASDSCIQTYA